MKRIKEIWLKYKTFLGKTIIVCLCGTIFGIGLKAAWEAFDKWRMLEYSREVIRGEAELCYNKYKCDLVDEVKHYIDSVSPTSGLNGYAVVDLCERYDLDIKFVLAQGQIESHFGTTGLAKKTNSVFNVGAFDKYTIEEINGRYKYRHPDHSIEPYMRLLYKDYITGGKTELDLMAKYVNKHGQRYSSNAAYENDMLRLYKKIDNTTEISNLQGLMRKYKIICGK